jgi:hypothetical protein
MGGFVCGVIRMGLQWSRSAPACGSNQPDNRFTIVTKVHYLHFAIILAGVTSVIIVVVSLLTPPRPRNKVNERTVELWMQTTLSVQDHLSHSRTVLELMGCA